MHGQPHIRFTITVRFPQSKVTPRLFDLPAEVLAIVRSAQRCDLRGDHIRSILGAVKCHCRVIDRHVRSLIHTNQALLWKVMFSGQLVKFERFFFLKRRDSVRPDSPFRGISNSLSDVTELMSINGHCESVSCLSKNRLPRQVGCLVRLGVQSSKCLRCRLALIQVTSQYK